MKLRQITSKLRRTRLRKRARIEETSITSVPRRRQSLDLRIGARLFEEVRTHVEDFSNGEEAGFLLCSLSRLPERDVLLARRFVRVPEEALQRGKDGSVLSWSAEFNSNVLQQALNVDATLVLVHSHGYPRPRFSPDDRRREVPLFGAFSRLLDPLPTGSVLLGGGDATGSFWLSGANTLQLRRVVICGDPIETWHSTELPLSARPARPRLARQVVAIPESGAKLADAKVAVVGISGGGSHVIQQLAHQGVGTLIAIDDQIVDETNLGRVVGATEADIDVTPKTALAKRVATGIDSSIEVIEVRHRFPSAEAITQLKEADIVVACLDTFRARQDVNKFCRRYLIPLIDIGMVIKTREERLSLARGQLIASLPDTACLRCWFLDDATLAGEQREHPAGYDQNRRAPGDPQVVSMNGTLASEACNTVLDLLTGYSGGERGARLWKYDGRRGELERVELPSRRPDCDACAEEGLGDPRTFIAREPSLTTPRLPYAEAAR
jgi:molybdopterin/thiamine biosynthesis adenylyltransferase